MTTIGLFVGVASTASSAGKTGDAQSAEGFGTAMQGVLQAFARAGTKTVGQSGTQSTLAEGKLVELIEIPASATPPAPANTRAPENPADPETPGPALTPVTAAPVALSATAVQPTTSSTSDSGSMFATISTGVADSSAATGPASGEESAPVVARAGVAAQATPPIVTRVLNGSVTSPPQQVSLAAVVPTTASDSGIQAGVSLPAPTTPVMSPPASSAQPVTQSGQPVATAALAPALPSTRLVEPSADAHTSTVPTEESGGQVAAPAMRGEQPLARASALPPMVVSTQATPLSANPRMPAEGGASLPVAVPTEEPAQAGSAQLAVPQPVSVQPSAPFPQEAAGPGAPSSLSAVPFTAQLARPLFTLAAAGPGEHVITITVTPDNLGPVTVRALVSSEGIRIELFAPSDLGRDAIRAILPELRRDLAGSGMGSNLDLSARDHPTDANADTPRDERGEPDARMIPDRETQQTHRTNQYGSSSTIDVMA